MQQTQISQVWSRGVGGSFRKTIELIDYLICLSTWKILILERYGGAGIKISLKKLRNGAVITIKRWENGAISNTR